MVSGHGNGQYHLEHGSRRREQDSDMVVAAVLATVLVTLALTLWLTARFIRWANRTRILDIPNHRSGHTAPTPRGAGLVIAGVTAGAAGLAAVTSPAARPLLTALVGAVPVVLVGWLDDRRGLHALPRFATHVLASAWGAGWLVFVAWHLSGITAVTTTIGLVLLITWFINLFNFMDGLDGLAAGQAAIGALALLVFGGGATLGIAIVMGALTAAMLGYLWFNWPPARVFMGDSGSTFLGYVLAVGALDLGHGSLHMTLASLLPLAPFLFDATATLVLRIARGERWWDAHRDHTYQQLVDAGTPVLATDVAYWSWAAMGLAVGLAVMGSGAVIAALLVTAYVAASAFIWLLARRLASATRPPLAAEHKPE